ncbi:MAG TPA: hypothetical protein VKU41_21375, partial [Polyangiaceae bacterium]|nr:hypothetical protein [Polyangiaceae bacterium]
MRSRKLWLAVLAVGLLLLLGGGRRSARADVTPRPVATAATSTDEAEPEHAEEVDPGDDSCSAGRRAIAQYLDLYRRGACAGHTPFHSLIALVPDPTDSGRSDWFDSALEGVEEAVAAGLAGAGPPGAATTYVRDRDWLPWPGADTAKRQARCWPSNPGVVLYRPANTPCTEPGFLVLLVGETPTWGVRAEQLTAALDQIDELEAWERKERLPEYRILGPTFSGSAASLAAVLRSRSDPSRGPASFAIVSGSATNPHVGETLEAAFGAGSASSVSYQTAT